MKHEYAAERILSIVALSCGLFGLLIWALTHLIGGMDPNLLLHRGDTVSFLAGVGALGMSTVALRQLEPPTILHRRATEGFVFGVIVLALTLGLAMLM